MNELLKQINLFLRAKVKAFFDLTEEETDKRVFHPEATDDAVFQYIVFQLDSSSTGLSPREDFYLEINFWDNKESTTELEDLVDAVDGDGDTEDPTGLNNRVIHNNKLSVIFHKENRQAIPDRDKRINRRQLRYVAQTYFM